MKKKANTALYILIGLFILILFSVFWVASAYNSLVAVDVTTEQKWGNVQSAYQRRADLIPNLVETVRGARDFEQETQTQIAMLRSQAGQIQTAVAGATTPAELQAVATDMGSVLSRLLVIVEAYPDLKAHENFLALQEQLEGTENRIKYERDEYNLAVKTYKFRTRRFPTNIIAGMFGFDVVKWDMFEAEEGAEEVPEVSFED